MDGELVFFDRALDGLAWLVAVLADDFSGEVGHLLVNFVPAGFGEVGGAVEFAAALFDADEGVVVVEVEFFEGGGEAGHFVADEGDVGTGFEGELDVISATVVADDGSHVEVVGEDEAFVAELVAEEAGEDFFAQGSGHFGVELREVEVAGHDGVQLGHEGGVWDEVFFEEICARDVGDGEVVVGVAKGEAVGGEVFSAGEDILLSHPAIKGASVVDDGLGIAAPAATAEAVVLLGVVA